MRRGMIQGAVVCFTALLGSGSALPQEDAHTCSRAKLAHAGFRDAGGRHMNGGSLRLWTRGGSYLPPGCGGIIVEAARHVKADSASSRSSAQFKAMRHDFVLALELRGSQDYPAIRMRNMAALPARNSSVNLLRKTEDGFSEDPQAHLIHVREDSSHGWQDILLENARYVSGEQRARFLANVYLLDLERWGDNPPGFLAGERRMAGLWEHFLVMAIGRSEKKILAVGSARFASSVYFSPRPVLLSLQQAGEGYAIKARRPFNALTDLPLPPDMQYQWEIDGGAGFTIIPDSDVAALGAERLRSVPAGRLRVRGAYEDAEAYSASVIFGQPVLGNARIELASPGPNAEDPFEGAVLSAAFEIDSEPQGGAAEPKYIWHLYGSESENAVASSSMLCTLSGPATKVSLRVIFPDQNPNRDASAGIFPAGRDAAGIFGEEAAARAAVIENPPTCLAQAPTAKEEPILLQPDPPAAEESSRPPPEDPPPAVQPWGNDIAPTTPGVSIRIVPQKRRIVIDPVE